MMKRFTCIDPTRVEAQLGRRGGEISVDGVVAEIIENVRQNGDAALLEYTRKFDRADLADLCVSRAEIDAALSRADAGFLEILRLAKENITAYHTKQKRQGFVMDERPGVVLGQKITPLDRVGIYVPGGTASLCSTVLMDAIPAGIAGVGEIVMATPPGPNGAVADDILVAASIAGVHKIYKMGGAQAIAALAYGTESIPRVDKIVGPGNIYVATAKRMVYGQVDIDMIAGPSEILVIADDSAKPANVAIDMLSQAEHDKLSAAFLVTTSPALADAVEQELERQLPTLPRREIAACSIENHSAVILTDTLENAVAISNAIAPEHLEVCVDQPFALLSLIRHAGSIFLGHNASEALGDYMAGPNHTLPTSGSARFFSALSVDDFIKKSSFLYYSDKAIADVADKVAKFARHEELEAHARSVESRLEKQ